MIESLRVPDDSRLVILSPYRVPAYGSPEHKEQIARRLSRNLRFRRLYGECRPERDR